MTAVLTPIDLGRHDKVRAHIDLPGVPAGTPGKVLQVTGLTWVRYRVLFDNGVEHGLLDGRHLVRPKEFVPVADRVAVEAPSPGADDGEVAPDADGGDTGDGNAFGVPAHLLERSKSARARLAG